MSKHLKSILKDIIMHHEENKCLTPFVQTRFWPKRKVWRKFKFCHSPEWGSRDWGIKYLHNYSLGCSSLGQVRPVRSPIFPLWFWWKWSFNTSVWIVKMSQFFSPEPKTPVLLFQETNKVNLFVLLRFLPLKNEKGVSPFNSPEPIVLDNLKSTRF
jgi:hypothetical protein